MRYRLMASYLGASYQAAVGPSDRDVTLFAAPPPPEEHGFSPAPGGHLAQAGPARRARRAVGIAAHRVLPRRAVPGA